MARKTREELENEIIALQEKNEKYYAELIAVKSDKETLESTLQNVVLRNQAIHFQNERLKIRMSELEFTKEPIDTIKKITAILQDMPMQNQQFIIHNIVANFHEKLEEDLRNSFKEFSYLEAVKNSFDTQTKRMIEKGVLREKI